ncbi:MAG: DNA alkylation repair protein [Candidatus Latescibacterota bacterium]|nr:MAG: DNA alkylation repair protein [Candidatus Latescibacterota bacterium]
MNYTEVMKKLEAMGTAQNRKVYARHGVGEKMFGVSFANLGKLRKEIKIDHGLATKLWASGNHDARILATMIADAAQMKSAVLEEWTKHLDNYVITDALSGLAGKTPFARAKMKKWTGSKEEWTGRAGWVLLAGLAMNDDELPDEFFEEYIEMIEANIRRSKNRVRDAMNSALITMGIRNGRLEKKAVAAAKRIGTVEVDHGETGCKTPDAVAYIQKVKARRKRR